MKLLKLIILQLKVSFGLSALRWYAKNNPKKFMSSLGIMAIVVVAFGPMLFLYQKLIQGAYDMAAQFGQPQLVLALALVTTSLFLLISSIAFVMSLFYFSNDIPQLVALPLKPGDILGAKFAVALFFNYLVVIPFFLPALWTYGVKTGAGAVYWLMGIVVFLLIPVIPLALVSIFLLVMMWLTNLSRKRDTMRLLGMFAILALAILFNLAVSQIPADAEAEFFQRLLLDEHGLLRLATRSYPPAFIATRALTAGGTAGVLNFGYFLGISLAGLGLMLALGQQIFYRGLIGGAEVQKGKAISREELARRTSGSSSPVLAIAMREIKYLIRTPIYLFNSLAMLGFVPILLGIQIAAFGGMEQLTATVQNAPMFVQIAGAAGFVAVMALFTPAASSSFSREGRLFYISQVIPVPPRRQILGKILYSFILAGLSLPLVIAAGLFLSWGIGDMLLALAAGIVLSFPAITISLLIDLIRPYLTWDDPQKAIKQNMNVVLAMLVGGGLYYLLYLLGKTVYQATGVEIMVYLCVLFAAFLAGAVGYAALMRISSNRYRDISV